MGRYSDPTGVDQTCPLIDEVISFLNGIEWGEGEEELGEEAANMVKVMEKIRAANSKLRSFGEKQYDRVNEVEKDLEKANNRIDELEKEYKWLEKERDKLSDTISDLEDTINELESNSTEI